MIEFLAAGASALWLGILTSISPCPLASNIAAVSYVGRRVGAPHRVILAGVAYSLGRAFTYVAIAAAVVGSLLSVPSVSFLLQQRMNQLLGPVLIVAGLAMIGWLRLPGFGGRSAGALEARLAGAGLPGAAGLGAIFALSFCPVSAGLFFGGLLPLAAGSHSRLLLPAIYGVGTGLPVVALASLLALGAGGIGRAFDALTRFERVATRVTGGVFVLAGVYLVLTHIVGLAI
ncbi:MAG TPA: aromatic aminobenezylarsenical efflux permease ArsG family transporter [Candidatus Eisenbacteria bacterium]|nr:aromatic aminobenezylarsenical efflux permease ArsG family transporter [Candidatus Eisenbacteria bacterium]